MPPKTKNAKVAKEGKITKKKIPHAAPDHSDMDWTSGDENGSSVKNLLTSMSTMLTALMDRVDVLDQCSHGMPKEDSGVPRCATCLSCCL